MTSAVRVLCVKFTGESTDFATIVHDKLHEVAVAQEALGSDVNRLTNILVDVCESHREQRDFTRAEIRRSIREGGCMLFGLSNLCDARP